MKLPALRMMLSTAAAASALLMTAACGSSEPAGSASDSSSSAPAAKDGGDSSSTGTFEDGDYEAEGSYSNPGGQSSVKVELTLADNEITDVTVTPEATNGTSKQFQTKFAGGIADEVVGKSIDELEVGAVAGSSLTGEGFNQAIEQIKGEAQA
ncbi:MAG: hypothetical protein JWQ91_2838 [Aeromicrobium sp.]|jgi:uncharacterized protein with FMN-binding domain|uniref:FMN-binding protein n=1 Tax=Aeromicrobium sp. TaxID=1871063 RepID=UPI00263746BD|nr:FMN-binding protein [Aeromicrobium sp.]MCW2788605.1 hypothetical protein [Aeromicrobium sp.]MCW2825921.1 hypothetical protein [Aeromicrobium sp.]